MQRREVFKLMGLAGLGLTRFSSSALAAQSKVPTQSVPGANIFEREKGRPNVFGWPLEEMHIPFRERKQKVKLPNGAKVAVRIVIAAEWDSGAENTGPNVVERTNLYALSLNAQYTFIAGLYRALDVMERQGVKASIMCDGAVVPAYPDLFQEIHKAGHEIMARSWDHYFGPATFKPGGEQAAELKRVVDGITQVTGERPVGWMAPGANTPASFLKLVADNNFLYTLDLNGDDIPYGLKFGNKTLVVLPHRQFSTSDFWVWLRTGNASPRTVDTAFEYFRQTFDRFYEAATEDYPLTIFCGVHPYWTCTPDRFKYHDKIIAYMKGFPGVYFTRQKELAQYWKETYLA
ncbi:MAG: polysaccharide deacetylase family protein [Acidobacteria bacterium]|nr:polysaccharide deacetylase family protein [Acidobacteriota bacterium]